MFPSDIYCIQDISNLLLSLAIKIIVTIIEITVSAAIYEIEELTNT